MVYQFKMENSSFSLNKRGDVYVLNMNAGENRFNETFIKHFHEVIDYLEGYIVQPLQQFHICHVH